MIVYTQLNSISQPTLVNYKVTNLVTSVEKSIQEVR